MGMFYGHNQVKESPSSGLGYGYLYNWYAAGHVDFPPTDWAIPTYIEFNTLISNTGGTSEAGGNLKSRDTSKWLSSVTYSDTDCGFEAYGAGGRNASDGTFEPLLTLTRYGAVSQFTAWPQLYISSSTITVTNLDATSGVNRKHGVSIRLIYKGTGTPSSTIEDYDGNVYDVVQIGTQYWTVQNWKCTHYNNGTVIPEVTDNTTWAGLTTGALCAYNNDWNYV